MLISAVLIGGMFVHSYSSGQDLPLLPAIAVIVVNLLAAAKLVLDVRARRQRQGPKPPPAEQGAADHD